MRELETVKAPFHHSTARDSDVMPDFKGASDRLKKIVNRTPLSYNAHLSKKYHCNIFLKREDLQVVRSYKLRGAYNMMSSLSKTQLHHGVVCASAGNHAQGFAYSCKKLNTKGVVFMPVITPNQKVNQTKMFGEDFVEIKLVGDTYDECAVAAKKFTEENSMTFVHPFNDYKIIEGQGTVGVEILEDKPDIDYLFIPIGGGGWFSGLRLLTVLPACHNSLSRNSFSSTSSFSL